ncbi:50S ribosomal protein L11 [Candidatus Woesebacteria bacterium]|nr:50S ribosomal protein L11 [Candidatus Woesebacteria bacterium]
MAKKVKVVLKINLPAGEATPAPPLGPALGQHGIPIMDFVRQYNDQTAKMKGQILPAEITIYEDRTFDFVIKKPPVSEMIKKTLGLDKGSGEAPRKIAGTLTREQVKKIAEEKLDDLNTDNIEAAMKIVEGTARSMGITIEKS